MGRSGCFGENQQSCAYKHCMLKFRDEFGNPSTITTTTVPVITTEGVNPAIQSDTSGGLLGGHFPELIGSGSGGFVVICIVIILCLCRARYVEKHKRRVIEEDYRVVATTLTNVTDSDGTTYEELCIDNPHYNRHEEVQLPSKKERKRLPGVSNTMSDNIKRWISVDANQATANTSKSLMQATNKPLPPIPEGNKAHSWQRGKEAASSKLSQSIDEYTEIGSEVKRRSNVYNPLDMERIGENRDSHGTYTMLRKSSMLENIRPPLGLPPGEYFTLEKVNDTVEHIPIPNGEYMTLAKEDDDENSTEHDRLLQTEMAAIGNGEPEVKPYAERCVIDDEVDSGICESGGLKNDYYILKKTSSGESGNSSDYIQPLRGDKHAYMQVMPEHTPVYPKS